MNLNRAIAVIAAVAAVTAAGPRFLHRQTEEDLDVIGFQSLYRFHRIADHASRTHVDSLLGFDPVVALKPRVPRYASFGHLHGEFGQEVFAKSSPEFVQRPCGADLFFYCKCSNGYFENSPNGNLSLEAVVRLKGQFLQQRYLRQGTELCLAKSRETIDDERQVNTERAADDQSHYCIVSYAFACQPPQEWIVHSSHLAGRRGGGNRQSAYRIGIAL